MKNEVIRECIFSLKELEGKLEMIPSDPVYVTQSTVIKIRKKLETTIL